MYGVFIKREIWRFGVPDTVSINGIAMNDDMFTHVPVRWQLSECETKIW